MCRKDVEMGILTLKYLSHTCCPSTGQATSGKKEKKKERIRGNRIKQLGLGTVGKTVRGKFNLKPHM